jgi:hypothetical protein
VSIEALSAVLSLNVGDSTRKLILIGLANHAHRDGTAAYAGIETLAAYANCSVRTVQRHVAKLVEDGFIREGDQSVIDARIPARYRPISYEVAMTEATAQTWALNRSDEGRRQIAAAHGRRGGSASTQVIRGDNLTPLMEGEPLKPVRQGLISFRGDNLTPLKAVDNSPSEVTRVQFRGDTSDASGVTQVSPKPSKEPSKEPTFTSGRGRDVRSEAVDNFSSEAESTLFDPPVATIKSPEVAPVDNGEAGDDVDDLEAERTVLQLPEQLRPDLAQALRLQGLVKQRLKLGWTREDMLRAVEQRLRPGPLNNPCGLFATALVPLKEAPQRRGHLSVAAPWCGHCDERTRWPLDDAGFPDATQPRCRECDHLAFVSHMERGAS